MIYLVLLFLPYVFSARSERMVLTGYETLSTRNLTRDIKKVLTVDGKECKFPFRQGGSIHHHCISISSSRSWCSLTHNFDQDSLWGYCSPETTQPRDLCQVNPCQNGGVCTQVPNRLSFDCSCPKSFTGRLCDQRKCFETIHLRYYDNGESWGRIHLRNVERCTCADGDISCERVPYIGCSKNPCENDGACRLLTATREEVCACRAGYSGPYCRIDSSQRVVVPLLPLNSPAETSPADQAKPAKKPVCGKRHNRIIPGPMGRILGGISAQHGSHPWMAAIYIGVDSFCAGTLVASCWVVSAAHCFFRSPLVSKIRVILGQHEFNVTTPDTRTFGVEKYIFPKSFSVYNPTLHDIVLLKLKKKNGRCVKKNKFIRPICLPDKDMIFPDHYCCQISGWGHKYEKQNQYNNLQEAGVRIVPFKTCTKPEVYGNHVTPNMVCAGINRCVDACQGDSGGPLACAKDDVSFLYGVISWGEGCGNTGKPGVYTKVVNYVNWINTIIKRKPKTE
ncbi:hepatocyte growth factor activator [Esox lucius]|uniref:trypsin n=1 Tax=Esox lucius TaxID=8010 RepID=A0AAY5K3W4_ESOLU|nr:hepatocyte growth factor activator [Esox lucius]